MGMTIEQKLAEAADLVRIAREEYIKYKEPTEKICSKTCETCRYFRKERDKRNIEISKKLFGENTICGYCIYWKDTYEVTLPTTEYDYCSHYSEIEE